MATSFYGRYPTTVGSVLNQSVAPAITPVHPRVIQLRQITVSLNNSELWSEFDSCTTEMIITRTGRRMFPTLKISISNLNPAEYYFVMMDIAPVDDNRYKFLNQKWVACGKGDVIFPPRLCIHPDSPARGDTWMKEPVSFYKVKLTNNFMDQQGHIILKSMQKYMVRVHIACESDIIRLPFSHFITFPLVGTSFIAVTAYQNDKIVNLKIEKNPFARGFRTTQREKKNSSSDDDYGDSREGSPDSSTKSTLTETKSAGSSSDYELNANKSLRNDFNHNPKPLSLPVNLPLSISIPDYSVPLSPPAIGNPESRNTFGECFTSPLYSNPLNRNISSLYPVLSMNVHNLERPLSPFWPYPRLPTVSSCPPIRMFPHVQELAQGTIMDRYHVTSSVNHQFHHPRECHYTSSSERSDERPVFSFHRNFPLPRVDQVDSLDHINVSS